MIADFGFRADYPGTNCSDGFDNDGDGLVDFPEDPGCSDADSQLEAPKCQDGINNDPYQDGLIDFDGGQSIHGGCSTGSCPSGVSDPDANGVANPDPQCVGKPWKNRETAGGGGCGLGAELLLLLPGLGLGLAGVRRRRGAPCTE